MSPSDQQLAQNVLVLLQWSQYFRVFGISIFILHFNSKLSLIHHIQKPLNLILNTFYLSCNRGTHSLVFLPSYFKFLYIGKSIVSYFHFASITVFLNSHFKTFHFINYFFYMSHKYFKFIKNLKVFYPESFQKLYYFQLKFIISISRIKHRKNGNSSS